MALVVPRSQASAAAFAEMLVPGGLVPWMLTGGLFQAGKRGKRGSMRRDHVTALCSGKPGRQSWSKICREMEPEGPVGILVPASVTHWGSFEHRAIWRCWCLSFSASESVGGTKCEAQSATARLQRSDAECGPLREGARGSSWG